MILEARQQFTLIHPAGQAAALAFVRNPALALGRVRFLRDLQALPEGASGELVVPVTMLGDVDLPFQSALTITATGAELRPIELKNKRAWVEVAGQAMVTGTGEMNFSFHFVAHLALPEAEGWGGAAFEKMVRAAANRTLERVAAALPEGLTQAMNSERPA